MHAARWSQLRPATGSRNDNARTRKIDRLDLLARVIHLRADCVADALSPADAHGHADWNALYDQAEHLGRQWAATDPTDAPRLLPSLLPGLQHVAERFERGYHDVASAAEHLTQAHVRASIPCRGVCNTCETDVALLLQSIDADEAVMACPCCGASW